MFQSGPLSEPLFAVQHQHGDGTWAPMEPEGDHLDPAEHDPERDWLRGHVYICRACKERVRIAAPKSEGSTEAG